MGDWLDSTGWDANYPHFLIEDEDAFVKGDLMLLVDAIGVTIYRNVRMKWHRIGGVGYLRMARFPLLLFDGRHKEMDMVAATARWV
jgi:hypothetical protein